jgi:CDP-diacylglycerol--serine O-phosphatidyltransferase
MMSDLEYPSFKSINWRTRRSPIWVLISIIVVAFAVRNWQWMPSVLFVSYLLYGLFRPWISRRWRREIEIEYEAADTPDDPITGPLVDEEAESAHSSSATKEQEKAPQDPAADI